MGAGEWIRVPSGVGGCGGSGRPTRAPKRFSLVLGLLSSKWKMFSIPGFALFGSTYLDPFVQNMG